jgi:hypothetical protein
MGVFRTAPNSGHPVLSYLVVSTHTPRSSQLITIGEKIMKSEMIPEILKAFSSEMSSTFSADEWVHIYTEESANPCKETAGAGFGCSRLLGRQNHFEKTSHKFRDRDKCCI